MISVTVDIESGLGYVRIDHEYPDELLQHVLALDESLLKFIDAEILHRMIDIAVERDSAEITMVEEDVS